MNLSLTLFTNNQKIPYRNIGISLYSNTLSGLKYGVTQYSVHSYWYQNVKPCCAYLAAGKTTSAQIHNIQVHKNSIYFRKEQDRVCGEGSK